MQEAEGGEELTPCVVGFERPIVCYRRGIMILRYQLEDGEKGSVCIHFDALRRLMRSARIVFRRILPPAKPRKGPWWRS